MHDASMIYEAKMTATMACNAGNDAAEDWVTVRPFLRKPSGMGPILFKDFSRRINYGPDISSEDCAWGALHALSTSWKPNANAIPIAVFELGI
ncbi:hypothetical protein DM860_003348 [Cuscuta australis]|uniref:Uncharacterized protein n=1 Tax=Cuscuta australis TaxID=267555 RepID=A0A328DJT3_9ASTE|nr:hypothetical protein DM860_003348 [Cuscuta australis]